MSEYAYSRYEGADPSNGKIDLALAGKLSAVVASLPDLKLVCDLGCGNGYLSGLLSRRGYRVGGVDVSESGIEIARRAHCEQGKPGIGFDIVRFHCFGRAPWLWKNMICVAGRRRA